MNKKIELFEPGMCCPTGLCGPSINSEVLRISTVVNKLEQKGAEIKRYNLTSNTKEFISNIIVNDLLTKEGENILPITLIDGKVEKKKAYPTNEEFSKWTGIILEQEKPKKPSSSCCSGGKCC
jgi:hypothetical protein